MYDVPGSDSGREWIEIQNVGTEAVSLAKWRLLEADTKHKITAHAGGDTLAPGNLAIIAASAETFAAEFNFHGQLFDSVFSLSNTGEALALLDENGQTIFSVSYRGMAEDGNSLNKSGNDYVARMPPPGAAISPEAITSPPKETKVTKPTAENPISEDIDATRNESVEREVTSATPERIVAAGQQTAADIFSKSSIVWWISALFIATVAGGALFYARSLQNKEWTIIEETE